MIRINKLNSKEYFGMLAIILLFCDIITFLNIPILRPVISFVCFSTIPGLLILHTLKINNISVVKKFLLSFGLSISFLIFGGLFTNSLSPIIEKPLSNSTVLVSLNTSLFILLLVSYILNRNNFYLQDFIIFESDHRKLFSPLIFSFLFPFISIFGTQLMNTQENNSILIFMIVLIPIYILTVFLLDSKIPKVTYPIVIFMVAISLHLMHTLTSNYLIGTDIHTEYFVSRLTINNMFWNISSYQHAYNACLSVAILPPIYELLLGIDVLYVFKIIFPILGAIIPVICYVIFAKYLEEKYAMLTSFFFMSQVPFINDLQSATRTEIAFIFFALLIFVFFDSEIHIINKRILFLIFVFSTIISHYSTSYLLLVYFGALSLCNKYYLHFFKIKNENQSTIDMGIIFLLLFIVIFFWYGQITSTPFNSFITVIKNTFISLDDILLNGVRAQSATAIVGVGVSGVSRLIVMIVQDLIILLLTVGLFYTLFNYKREKYTIEYISIMLVSWLLMASMFVLPFVSTSYGVYRTYQMGLVTISPMLFKGTDILFKKIKLQHFSTSFFIIILTLQFFCATYFVDQIFGNPNCVELNRQGDKYQELYIFDSEVSGSKWISEYGIPNSIIHTDVRGYTRILSAFEKKPPTDVYFFTRNLTVKDGYIYLTHTNIVDGRVFTYLNTTSSENISNYIFLFNYKSTIYNNGGSEVYI